MRSHGASGYPRPDRRGVFIMTRRNTADYRSAPASARRACAQQLADVPRDGKPELSPAMQAQADGANRAFARCMRRHRIRKFPYSWNGGINTGQMQRLGINTSTPQFSAALKACGF